MCLRRHVRVQVPTQCALGGLYCLIIGSGEAERSGQRANSLMPQVDVQVANAAVQLCSIVECVGVIVSKAVSPRHAKHGTIGARD